MKYIIWVYINRLLFGDWKCFFVFLTTFCATRSSVRSYARSLVRSHCSLIRLLRSSYCACALRYALLFARSFTPKLVGKCMIRCLKTTWFCPTEGRSWNPEEAGRVHRTLTWLKQAFIIDFKTEKRKTWKEVNCEKAQIEPIGKWCIGAVEGINEPLH